jgi:cytochrome oxidase Cu insertion factor (SCO1/SenC/PrrC family)
MLVGALFVLLVLPALWARDDKDNNKGKPHDPALLQVGRVAPEIEGEDIDGVQFKLSDYRGKVVLLDFWGHW